MINVLACSGGDEFVGRADGRARPSDAASDHPGETGVPTGDAGSDATPRDARPPEVCGNGLDDNDDGAIDEGCACAPGQTQSCSSGRAGQVMACRAGRQNCVAEGGAEFARWGSCVPQLCEGSGDSLDSGAMHRVLGPSASARFAMVGFGMFGDLNGDGELDWLGTASRGGGPMGAGSAAWAFLGNGCRQRSILDLASGGADGRDASRTDLVALNGAEHRIGMADVNGDGRSDLVLRETRNVGLVVFGQAMPPGRVDDTMFDGVRAVRMVDGLGGQEAGPISATDFDGDGYADVFMGAYNSSTRGGGHGLAMWLGRPTFPARQMPSAEVSIGIGTVGVSSQANFAEAAGNHGDYNNDGYLDVSAMNGAANDGMRIDYRSYVYFGNAQHRLPASMPDVDGSNGFRVSGPSWGLFPGTQSGDFDGDGVDDYVVRGYQYSAYGADVWVLPGRRTWPAAITLDERPPLSLGVRVFTAEIASGEWHDSAVGLGDIDADGFDDLAVPDRSGGFYIVWGRVVTGGTIDPAIDARSVHTTGTMALGRVHRIAVADADGDGLGDVFLGLQSATTANGANSGVGLIRYGSCIIGSRGAGLRMGGDGSDQFTGTPADERFASGRGDDRIDGGGGGDVVYAGAGNDVVVVHDALFRRLDGGLNTRDAAGPDGDYRFDTLRLDAPGLALDFRTMGRLRVHDFERFDLTAPGEQRVAFNAGDLSAMSTTSREFWIDGDATDGATLDGGFVDDGDRDGDDYVEFRRGALVVHIRRAIAMAGRVTLGM